jgi:hypothetical protein
MLVQHIRNFRQNRLRQSNPSLLLVNLHHRPVLTIAIIE